MVRLTLPDVLWFLYEHQRGVRTVTQRVHPPSIVDRAAQGEFVISIQLDPPSGGTSSTDLFRFAADLIARGWSTFDVNSTRRPLAMSSLAIAAKLQGVDGAVIPHITAREALVRSICSDIRSAYDCFGVRDVLIIRGDPAEDDHRIENGALRAMGGVFELEAPALVGRVASDVRGTCGASELRIGVAYTLPPSPDACIAVGVKEAEAELERLRAKFSAGADFVMTQPVFRMEDWLRVRRAIDSDPSLRDRPYLVGVWPIFDERTMAFLADRGCDGVFLPRQIRDELGRRPPADWPRWSMDACAELLQQLRRSGTAAGAYIVTPFRKGFWASFLEQLPKLRA